MQHNWLLVVENSVDLTPTILLADAVDEQLDATATRAREDVEPLLVHEQLAQLAEEAPAGPLVKLLRADELQDLRAPRTGHWIVFA